MANPVKRFDPWPNAIARAAELRQLEPDAGGRDFAVQGLAPPLRQENLT
jgi:hypothetical protein